MKFPIMILRFAGGKISTAILTATQVSGREKEIVKCWLHFTRASFFPGHKENIDWSDLKKKQLYIIHE